MQVTYVHFCDYASISREGKLSAMGIFDTIFLPVVPGTYPLMYVALELALYSAELGRPFQMQVKLADQDGNVVMDVTASGQINGAVSAGQLFKYPQILALAGVPLQRVGAYSLDLFLNGDHKQAVMFTVVLGTQGANPGLPGLPK